MPYKALKGRPWDKEEAKSKELGPMELAEQTKRRRSLHRRAEKQGLLGKMFALSKELQGVSP